MFERWLASISLTWKMALAAALPIVGLIFFSATYSVTQWQSAEHMRKTVELTAFSRTVSELVHELQVERGRTAGFIGSGKASGPQSSLEAQRRVTDEVLARFNSAMTEFSDQFSTAEQRGHLAAAVSDLAGLTAHRSNVTSRIETVPEAVGPYTRMITDLITLIADESANVGDAELSSPFMALLSLTQAKEASGLERAQGNAVLSSGRMTPQLHTALVSLSSLQRDLFEQFEQVADAEWTARLEAVESGEAAAFISETRTQLLSAGYGGALPQVEAETWFTMTTERINQLMEVEHDLTTHIEEIAATKQSAVQMGVWIIVALSILITLLTIAASYVLIMNIVAPLTAITGSLEKLSKGETDLDIEGTDRGDEIGVLARAAHEFMGMTQQREILVRQNAQNEHDALVDRRRVLDTMAKEVEGATYSAVSKIVRSAEELAHNSEDMRRQLESANENAKNANSTTSESLEGTQRASDLAAELNAAIAEVAESIMRGDKLARDSVQLAVDSRSTVEELDEATQQIGDFVRVITELAEQTNLLALNATIESARAGEHGKGFAVVASEIKQLAAQTNLSATQITERVSKIQSSTKTAVDAIGRISESIENLGGVTSSVAAAVEEQRVSTDSFTSFLNTNRNVIERVAKQVSDLAAITMKSAEGAVGITRRVEEMADASRNANEEIPKIVQRAVSAADNRNAPRSETHKQVTLKSGGREIPATLKDVSISGARISKPSKGNMKVKLPDGMGEVDAHTAWTSEIESGVEFEEKLPLNIMEQLIATNKSDVA